MTSYTNIVAILPTTKEEEKERNEQNILTLREIERERKRTYGEVPYPEGKKNIVYAVEETPCRLPYTQSNNE